MSEKKYDVNLPEHDELISIRDYFSLDDFIIDKCKNETDVKRILDLVWSDSRLQVKDNILTFFHHRYQNAKKTADGWRTKAKDKLDYLTTVVELEQEKTTKKNALDKVRQAFDKTKFVDIRAKLLEVYNFDKNEIEMIDYFISQCKQEKQDPSRNIALMFYSNQRTGKSTVARAFCESLNGTLTNHKSTLARELQYRNFDRPFAIQNNCTLLDEAQHKDMSGVYGQLKEILTSNSCSVEYKFRNELVEYKCKRNYIFCTNNHPYSIIKSEKERRFAVIDFNDKIRKQLTEKQVFELWNEYICAVNYDEKQHSERYSELLERIWYAGEDSEIIENCREMVEEYLQDKQGVFFSIRSVQQHVISFMKGKDLKITNSHVRKCCEKYLKSGGGYYKPYTENPLPF